MLFMLGAIVVVAFLAGLIGVLFPWQANLWVALFCFFISLVIVILLTMGIQPPSEVNYFLLPLIPIFGFACSCGFALVGTFKYLTMRFSQRARTRVAELER